MLDLGFGRPTLSSTKTFSSNPSVYQNFLLKTHPSTKITHQNTNFHFQTHISTKIWYSEPFHLPKFYNYGAPNPSIYQYLTIFLENDPSIFLHQPFKTHPSTSSIPIHKICETMNMQILFFFLVNYDCIMY